MNDFVAGTLRQSACPGRFFDHMDVQRSRPTRLAYRIDDQDRIHEVDEGWRDSAGRLGTAEVLGRPLWDFVRDPTVVAIYRQMIRHAREGHPVRFSYRCDAPEARRLYRMVIHKDAAGLIEFATDLIREEKRSAVPLLVRAPGPRSRDFVRVCSWCERAQLPDGAWVAIEAAVEALGVMETTALPQLTHGICPRCADRVRRGLERDRARARAPGRAQG